ncbi:nuclear speckle RNA-binding protein B-like [Telopea speciosissima]|uniref:nuclear speckle RNA-binding protein B-like n=1 Tax=Telopea speciosissima TaxID=54955 RepID=UPI001CC5377F|nr:nuclear speckle RNA-binding protein B-like [Telopea speciosissima]
MDSPEFPTSSSSPPRKEIQIQGPRPAPLKVRKDSYKIKKPPLVPQQPSQLPPPQPPRQPVIIYTVSPKVIHTTASDFMTLVQRLTGPNSSSSSSSFSYTTVSSSSSSSSLSSSYVDNTASVLASPAARFASIEKVNNNSPTFQAVKSRKGSGSVAVVESRLDEDIRDASGTVERTCLFPGILSPGPSSFPPISPNFFSPTPDPNSSSLAFLQDLSPIFHGNRSYIDGTMVPSPTTFFSSAPLTSPTPFMDLFNQFDL